MLLNVLGLCHSKNIHDVSVMDYSECDVVESSYIAVLKSEQKSQSPSVIARKDFDCEIQISLSITV